MIARQVDNAMKHSACFALLAVLLLIQIAGAETGPGSFAYVLQAESFDKTKSAAVEKLAVCVRDWVVLDAVFDGDTTWERADLDRIRLGAPGER